MHFVNTFSAHFQYPSIWLLYPVFKVLLISQKTSLLLYPWCACFYNTFIIICIFLPISAEICRNKNPTCERVIPLTMPGYWYWLYIFPFDLSLLIIGGAFLYFYNFLCLNRLYYKDLRIVCIFIRISLEITAIFDNKIIQFLFPIPQNTALNFISYRIVKYTFLYQFSALTHTEKYL